MKKLCCFLFMLVVTCVFSSCASRSDFPENETVLVDEQGDDNIESINQGEDSTVFNADYNDVVSTDRVEIVRAESNLDEFSIHEGNHQSCVEVIYGFYKDRYFDLPTDTPPMPDYIEFDFAWSETPVLFDCNFLLGTLFYQVHPDPDTGMPYVYADSFILSNWLFCCDIDGVGSPEIVLTQINNDILVEMNIQAHLYSGSDRIFETRSASILLRGLTLVHSVAENFNIQEGNNRYCVEGIHAFSKSIHIGSDILPPDIIPLDPRSISRRDIIMWGTRVLFEDNFLLGALSYQIHTDNAGMPYVYTDRFTLNGWYFCCDIDGVGSPEIRLTQVNNDMLVEMNVQVYLSGTDDRISETRSASILLLDHILVQSHETN